MGQQGSKRAFWHAVQVYTIYSILSIVFVILVIVTAFITIALTYFQLAVEDHRWWWRSFLCGGSTGAIPQPGSYLTSMRPMLTKCIGSVDLLWSLFSA